MVGWCVVCTRGQNWNCESGIESENEYDEDGDTGLAAQGQGQVIGSRPEREHPS